MANKENNKAIYDNSFIITFSPSESALFRNTASYYPSPRDKYHIVKEGEDLLRISNKYYFNEKLWYIIGEANNIVDPFEIPVGESLIIPDSEIRDRIW